MVEQEQLALVVAELLAEGQGLVDDLLGAADRQRRLAHELFQRRAVAIHRRVVEERAEALAGDLGITVDVDVPAQPDHGLLRGAVAVVGETRTVEGHHALEVPLGPENVAGEETIAMARRLLGDLRGADRAMPDERRQVVQWPRDRGEAVQRGAEAALPVDVFLAPQAVQQVVVVQRQRQALHDVLAEPGIDRRGVAAPEHQVHAPARQVLQHRILLGQAHRVVGGDQRGRGGEDQA